MRAIKASRILFTLPLVLLLPACGLENKTSKRRNFNAETLLCEARLVDVAFPLNVEIRNLTPHKNDMNTSTHQSVYFETTMKTEELISFYKSQMERLGWKQGPIVWTDEAHPIDERTILVFEKPARLTLVTIDAHSRGHLSVTCSQAGRQTAIS